MFYSHGLSHDDMSKRVSAGMAEAAFTELRSRRSFDVVRCFGRSLVVTD